MEKRFPCGEWSGKCMFTAAVDDVTFKQTIATAAGNKTKELHSRRETQK